MLHRPQPLGRRLLDAPAGVINQRLTRHAVGKTERADGGAVSGRVAGAGGSRVGRRGHDRQLRPGGGRGRRRLVPHARQAGQGLAGPRQRRLGGSRIGRAVGGIASGAAERFGVTHLRAGEQRLDGRGRAPFLQGEPLDPRRDVRQRPRRLLLLGSRRAEPAHRGLVGRMRAAHGVRSAPARDPGVPPIALEELLDGAARGLERLEGGPIGLEAPEGLGDVGDDRGGDRGQRLTERGRQPPLVELARELRLAQLDEEVHERAVAVLTQLEQRLIDGAPVGRGGGEDLAAIPDRLGQAFPRQRRAGRALEKERLADALAGDEEPPAHEPAPLDGPEAGTQREIVPGALVVAPAELQPRVAEPILIFAEQEVPLDPLRRIAIGFQAVGRGLAVEEERQLQGQHARLPRAVVAAQQQTPLLVTELLVVVPVDVEQPAPDGLPPSGVGHGQLGPRPAVARRRGACHSDRSHRSPVTTAAWASTSPPGPSA